MVVSRISPFPTMFSNLTKTEVIILATFNMLSANALDLDKSKSLLFGKELQVHSTKQCLIIQIHDLPPLPPTCKLTAGEIINILTNNIVYHGYLPSI